MNISWGLLENWMSGPWKPPTGCTLEYEFRPSLHWYPNIHTVHEFWKAQNPDDKRCYWHLDRAERDKAEQAYLQAKYRLFTRRKHWECAWQRFTLTNPKGEKIILQMNSQGHVDEVRPVEKTFVVFEVVS